MSVDTKQTRLVNCPTCKRSTRYDETNPHRPFCCARCKDQDIVAWAEERYRVPVPSPDEEDSPTSADLQEPAGRED